MRNPNFGVIHSWWVAEANLTANTNAKSDDHPLADTDDESQPTINLIYSILETLAWPVWKQRVSKRDSTH